MLIWQNKEQSLFSFFTCSFGCHKASGIRVSAKNKVSPQFTEIKATKWRWNEPVLCHVTDSMKLHSQFYSASSSSAPASPPCTYLLQTTLQPLSLTLPFSLTIIFLVGNQIFSISLLLLHCRNIHLHRSSSVSLPFCSLVDKASPGRSGKAVISLENLVPNSRFPALIFISLPIKLNDLWRWIMQQ